MNIDFYSTLINYYIIFEKGIFRIMSIYLHWKLKMDEYYGTIFFPQKRHILWDGGSNRLSLTSRETARCDDQ